MKILTCNVRYSGADDGANGWAQRRDMCIQVIRDQAAQVICLQETWADQRADLMVGLPEYSSYGLLDEPIGGRPMNTIFYQRDAFTLLDAGGYWLSQTPHVSGSSSWDSACVRFANWVRLEDRNSGKSLRIVNTHLDHVAQTARENQARILVEDAQAYAADDPQVLTGDLNCDGTNRAIDVLRSGGWQDSYEIVHDTDDPGHTFHGFQGAAFAPQQRVGKMDWVLVRGAVTVHDASVIDTQRQGRYPSDHYFVSAEFEIGGD